MALSRATARKLCTATECRLIEESFPKKAAKLTAGAIRRRIARARRLRDKYRKQATDRARTARGKTGRQRKTPARAGDSAETKQKKQRLFSETMARFEKRLSSLDGETRRGRRTPAKRTRRGSARRPSQVALAKKALAGKRRARTTSRPKPRSRTAHHGMKPKPADLPKTVQLG